MSKERIPEDSPTSSQTFDIEEEQTSESGAFLGIPMEIDSTSYHTGTQKILVAFILYHLKLKIFFFQLTSTSVTMAFLSILSSFLMYKKISPFKMTLALLPLCLQFRHQTFWEMRSDHQRFIWKASQIWRICFKMILWLEWTLKVFQIIILEAFNRKLTNFLF
jgi:hypothetical protein